MGPGTPQALGSAVGVGAEKTGVGKGGSSGSGGHRLWREMLRPVQWTDGDRWWFNIECIVVAVEMCCLHALHCRTLL